MKQDWIHGTLAKNIARRAKHILGEDLELTPREKALLEGIVAEVMSIVRGYFSTCVQKPIEPIGPPKNDNWPT